MRPLSEEHHDRPACNDAASGPHLRGRGGCMPGSCGLIEERYARPGGSGGPGSNGRMSTARRAGSRCMGPDVGRVDCVGRGATLAEHRQGYGACDTVCGREEGPMGRLEGKVALISGGARGQGATEARLFAQEGARVVVGDILDAVGKHVEEAIRAQGGEATYVHLDVTHEADWVEAVGTAVNRYGKLDVLVNNAGIVLRKGIEDTTEADWDHIMAVNAK